MVSEKLMIAVNGSSRAETVARLIEDQIADGSLPAGHWLGTKDSLRREFNVAAATFNEAVRLLSSRGVVKIRPGAGGGLFVASPTAFVRLGREMLELKGEPVSVADSLVVRTTLDQLVITEATRHANSHDVHGLRQIIDEMARPGVDNASYLRISWKLHRRMAELSPNLVLRHIYLGLLGFVSDRVRSVTATSASAYREGVRVHSQIVDVIASGDLTLVANVAEEHAHLTTDIRGSGE